MDATPAEKPRARILVADDEPQVVALMQNALEKAGYTAITAASFEEALEKAHADPMDLIVLDATLPDILLHPGEGADSPKAGTPDRLQNIYFPPRDQSVARYPMSELLRLFQRHPGAALPPFLLTIGKTSEMPNWDLDRMERWMFMTKPFHPLELLQYVERLLAPTPNP